LSQNRFHNIKYF